MMAKAGDDRSPPAAYLGAARLAARAGSSESFHLASRHPVNSQAIGVVTALLAGLAIGVGYESGVHPFAAVGVVMLLFGGGAAFDLRSKGTGTFPTADHRPPPLTGSPYGRPVQQAVLDVNNAISWRSVR